MANKRKTLSKKIRFEVLKRDKFTCQYCGRSAPEVVLHVDHIHPVAKGGENDLLNLITSCAECNFGKGAVPLSDDSAILKQTAQLQELADRKEQLEMIMEWKTELLDLKNKEIDYIADYLGSMTNYKHSLNDNGRNTVREWLLKYSVAEIIDALELSYAKYYKPKVNNMEECFKKVGAILYYDHLEDKHPYYYNYLKKATFNEFGYFNESSLKELVFRYIKSEDDFEKAKKALYKSHSWTQYINAAEKELIR